ncbi:MAG: hypothetical protein Q9220_002005 [cf. Caloplaca sp. 1 TL-2023]
MRIFQPQWVALTAVLIPIALNPSLASDTKQDSSANDSNNENTTLQSSLSTPDPKATAILLESILQKLTPKRLRSTRSLELRAPVETPPTQFLPYPPPPGYVYPPGENAANQNPQPSEFNPPPGVYGSAYAQGASSSSSSASAASRRSLQTPLLLSLLLVDPLGIITFAVAAALLPTTIALPRNAHLIEARAPVETPPTQFLPYPPPPGYVYPPGTSPATQDPQPTEFNPPAGVYGGASNSGSGQQSSSGGGYNSGITPRGGGGVQYSSGHLAWILAVTIVATMVVTFLGTKLWLKRKEGGGGGGGGEKGEKFKGMLQKVKGWGKKKGPAAAEA